MGVCFAFSLLFFLYSLYASNVFGMKDFFDNTESDYIDLDNTSSISI